MHRIRRFLDNAWISYRALFRYLDATAYLATKVIWPLELLITFALLGSYATGPETVPFYLVGNSVVLVAINGVSGVATAIAEERGLGTLPFLIASPARRMGLLLERAFGNVLDGMVTVALAFFFGWLLFGLDFGRANLAGLSLAILAASFATACFGMLLGVISLPVRDVVAVTGAAFVALMALTGVNFPVDALPAFLQPLSWILPLTRSITAARAAMDGAATAALLDTLGAEVAVGLAYWALAGIILGQMERAALRRGELESI